MKKARELLDEDLDLVVGGSSWDDDDWDSSLDYTRTYEYGGAGVKMTPLSGGGYSFEYAGQQISMKEASALVFYKHHAEKATGGAADIAAAVAYKNRWPNIYEEDRRECNRHG